MISEKPILIRNEANTLKKKVGRKAPKKPVVAKIKKAKNSPNKTEKKVDVVATQSSTCNKFFVNRVDETYFVDKAAVDLIQTFKERVFDSVVDLDREII